MKKILLALACLGFATGVSAQELMSDNFNGLNVGNIGTDLTGVTPGQGGWYTFNATGGTNNDNTNYQVVASNGTNTTNVLQLTGSNAATGNKFMWKSGLDTAWGTRTIGNDIIEVEFDFNPSAASTSNNSFRLYLYSDEATPKVLAGIGITCNAVVSTVPFQNVVNGFAHWTSTPGTGTYSFGLGPNAATPVTLVADTWVKLGFSFNTLTGEIKWKGPGFSAAFTGNPPTFPVVTAGLNPGELDFLVAAGTGNTVAHTAYFDNLVVRASATDTLLGLEDVSTSNTLTVYPNPANDFVTVSSSEFAISAIEMTDINGRIVRSIANNATEAQINISDLAQGVYVLKITSGEGAVTTKKLVKN